jgi:hypothetical protein
VVAYANSIFYNKRTEYVNLFPFAALVPLRLTPRGVAFRLF